ncbi:MAG: glycosyltransferase family 2 protein [Mycobacteriales bacterium]
MTGRGDGARTSAAVRRLGGVADDPSAALSPRRITSRALGASACVSVVVPCYNYGRYLGECVSSALDQPGVEVEVIVVDDASSDGSADVADAIASGDSRVRVIRHTRNQGHIRTYNEGLSHVQGDFVVLLSADDVLPLGSLSRAVALMRAHPSVGLVYGHPRNFTGSAPQTSARVRSWTVWSGHRWIRQRCRTVRNPIYSPEAVMRAAVLRAVGPYDESLPHSGDLDIWLRAAARSDVGRVNGPDQGLRRIHGANMSENSFAEVLVDLRERARAFDAFFAGAGSGLRDAARLSGLARRNLARCALEHACDEVVRGDGDLSVVDLCRSYASAWAPDAQLMPAWRELDLRLEGHAGSLAGLECAARAAYRDVRWRLAWRRWRRSGV